MSEAGSLILEQSDKWRVTDRNYPECLSFANLSEADINGLPPKAVVIDVGSGLNQLFSQGVRSQRPDITVVSIDPTLSLREQVDFQIESYIEPLPGKLSWVIYSKKTSQTDNDGRGCLSGADLKAFIQQRLITAHNNAPVIVALAPDLPFRSDSADLIIETFGPFSKELDKQKYFKEILRVLKVNGQARIYPIPNDNTINIEEEIIEINQGPSARVECYQKFDPITNTTKSGFIITKLPPMDST